jgi:gamma-glutamyltranspeptidase/glutathione hydrolase
MRRITSSISRTVSPIFIDRFTRLPSPGPRYTAAHMRAFPASLLLLLTTCTVAPAAHAQALTRARAPQSIPIPEGTAGGPIPDYAQEQPARSLHAMVVSIHHIAADSGLATLQRGGNAVDAAVTTAFTLAVVYPYAGNLGGGGFMLVHLSGANGKHPKTAPHNTGPHNTFIDFRETAPAAATANMYLDAQGKVIPGLSIIGARSTGVPGSVAGLALAEKQYGRLGLKRAMAPAIALAENGFTLGPEEAALLNDPELRKYSETRAIFGAKTWVAGDVFRQPLLARTLRRIAADPDSFYRGKLAQELAAGLKTEGSLITAQDLAAYHAIERTPIEGQYKDLTILSSPPPSSGGVTLLETLHILDAEPSPDLRALGDRSIPWTHWIVEAFRRAYMDRNDYLGDPAFVRMPLDQMLSPAYALAWRKTIDPDHATASASLVRPAGFLPPAPTEGTIPLAPEKQETTHFSILDQDGNAVAVTTTLNGAFGSKETAPGLGFLLNDEMDDFTSKVGAPNMFQLIQGPANAIAPGKRPLSSMTPTIVLAKNGTVRMVLGSPGGSRIISTVANIFLSAEYGGLNIQSAVDAPRFHQQYLPDTVDVEPGFSPSIVAGLRAMGYHVTQGTHVWSDGECIERDPDTGVITGGQDHRRHFGKAAGY